MKRHKIRPSNVQPRLDALRQLAPTLADSVRSVWCQGITAARRAGRSTDLRRGGAYSHATLGALQCALRRYHRTVPEAAQQAWLELLTAADLDRHAQPTTTPSPGQVDCRSRGATYPSQGLDWPA